MPRAIWSGSISFGLVNVPVKLYAAVRPRDVRFHQLDSETGARVRNKRVSEETGDEVPYERIVKGYELDDGQYVVVTSEELEAAEPDATRVVEIEDFVDLSEIDPVYFDATYYLAPDRPAAAKAYSLLRKAMEDTGKVALGRFVMRTKQYLAAIRPMDGVLAINTMNYPDEVVDPKTIEGVPEDVGVSEREMAVAEQLIESMATEWEPDRYHDSYREHLLDLIQRKAEGEEIVSAPVTEERGAVIDLMAALEASLAATESGGRSRATASDDMFEGLTKSELSERAAAAGIAGRSKMSKDELVAALREARQPERRRRSA